MVYVSVSFVYVCTYGPVVTCGMCVCVLCACLYIRLWFSVCVSLYIYMIRCARGVESDTVYISITEHTHVTNKSP